ENIEGPEQMEIEITSDNQLDGKEHQTPSSVSTSGKKEVEMVNALVAESIEENE
ncbi:8872_t:CDS:2, partial [Gigaspora rosea]